MLCGPCSMAFNLKEQLGLGRGINYVKCHSSDIISLTGLRFLLFN